jgi:hypothetical protein
LLVKEVKEVPMGTHVLSSALVEHMIDLTHGINFGCVVGVTTVPSLLA